MPSTLKRKKIEPRVSESTFDRMRFLTGSSLGSIKNSTVLLTIDGETFEVDIDANGVPSEVRPATSKVEQ